MVASLLEPKRIQYKSLVLLLVAIHMQYIIHMHVQLKLIAVY